MTGHSGAGGGNAVDRGRKDFSFFFFSFFLFFQSDANISLSYRQMSVSISVLTLLRIHHRVGSIAAANEFCSKYERERVKEEGDVADTAASKRTAPRR